MRTSVSRYNSTLGLAWLVCAVVLVGSADANETIRYKFTAGETIQFKTTQKMEMLIKSGGAPPVETTTDVVTGMSWVVKEVKDDGSAIIDQTTTRFQIKTTAGVGGMGFEIDSASAEEPKGPIAKMLAPALKAMTGEPFRVTMTSRGEPLDVQVPDKVTAALKKTPMSAQMGEWFTEEGFKKTIQQSAIVFPQGDLTQGQEWTTKIEMNNPALGGKQTVEMKYRYEGQEKVDGELLDKFAVEMKMDFGTGGAGLAEARMTVSAQDSKGTIYFDREAGRMNSASIHLEMDMDIVAAGQTLDMHLDQNVNVSVEPVKE